MALLDRIANYFKEWDGIDETAPKMELNIHELRYIANMNVERCRLIRQLNEANLKTEALLLDKTQEIRAKAIDEMLEELQEVIDEHGERYVMMFMKERAKQMKASEDIDEDLRLQYCYEDLSSAENRGYMQGHNEAIDEFFSELCKVSERIRPVGWTTKHNVVLIKRAYEIAEQMKAGGIDG